MSDPFYPYTGGGFPSASGDDAPPRRYTDYEVDLIAARYADVPLPNVSFSDVPLPKLSSAEVGYFDAHVGSRRSVEVLYQHSFMGSRSTIGQSEPLYSSNTKGKRPRLESSLTIYPQRPGEKACAFYMRNRTCKYGEDCKFDHPHWVLEDGTQNWREVQNVEDSYPERPGKPDCPYFMKSGECNFKSRCKFNHPKEKLNEFKAGTDNEQSLIADSAVLPVRSSEAVCSYYEKTGKCKFGARCRFNHPKDNEAPVKAPTLTGKQTIYTATIDAAVYNGATDGSIPAKMHTPVAPAESHNAKGLPIRPGEVDCSFYVKTGSCMYGSICRYNHPDRPVVDAAATEPVAQGHCAVVVAAAAEPVAQGHRAVGDAAAGEPVAQGHRAVADAAVVEPVAQGILPTPAPIAPVAVLNPIATFLPGFGIHATLMPVEPEPIIYPQRPGETVCDFYMKTGYCKYTDKCKFHHPIDRSAPRPNESWDPQQTVTLTLAGLPRREDAEVCGFYMRSGTCKFGVHCKFDHPPVEAIAKLKAAGGKIGGKKVAKLMKAAAAAAAKQVGKKAEGLSTIGTL